MKLLLKLTTCCLLIMAYGCSEPSFVGEELLEEAIPFNALRTDTVTVKLTTIKPDWIKTNNNSLGYYLMGQIADESDFGSTNASIFTQTRLAQNTTRIGSDEIYDSLVLQLVYNFHYGDTMDRQTIKVFELSDSLFCPNNTCYQNKDIKSFPNSVGELIDHQHQFSGSIVLKSPVFSSNDTTSISEEIIPSHLRIKLNDELGQRLFNFFPDPESNDQINNTLFLDVLKGFHIEVDKNASDENLMVSYALQTNPFSKMVLYYHTEDQDYIYTDSLNTDSVLVTTYSHKTIDFSINNAIIFNQIRNDYKGSALAALNSRPGDEGDELAYIQAGGGLHVKVEFPHIKNGDLDNVLINKATLSLHQIPSADSLYNPLALISMYDSELYDDGFYITVDDFEARSLLDTLNWKHTFNFPALLQNMLECENGEDTIRCENSEEIILVPTNNSFSVSRAIIAGDTNDELEAKLELIYTPIE